MQIFLWRILASASGNRAMQFRGRLDGDIRFWKRGMRAAFVVQAAAARDFSGVDWRHIVEGDAFAEPSRWGARSWITRIDRRKDLAVKRHERHVLALLGG